MFNVSGEETAHRQLLVICDFYWFSTLRIKINAENKNFVDTGIDTVAAAKPTMNFNHVFTFTAAENTLAAAA